LRVTEIQDRIVLALKSCFKGHPLSLGFIF
jgi:hypothetical protein